MADFIADALGIGVESHSFMESCPKQPFGLVCLPVDFQHHRNFTNCIYSVEKKKGNGALIKKETTSFEKNSLL
jgi:hypothetical protein